MIAAGGGLSLCPARHYVRPMHEPLDEILLADPLATDRLGRRLAGLLRAGDTVLLSGPVGAGKSHLARAIILALLAEDGRVEDVPSPTYTLVQRYDCARGDLLHADLYRVEDVRDLDDTGLADALGTAVCLVEWPEVIVPSAPDALVIALRPDETGGARIARIASRAPRWQVEIAGLLLP